MMDHEDPAAQRALTAIREAEQRRSQSIFREELVTNAAIVLIAGLAIVIFLIPVVKP
jgi:hypothetical protein